MNPLIKSFIVLTLHYAVKCNDDLIDRGLNEKYIIPMNEENQFHQCGEDFCDARTHFCDRGVNKCTSCRDWGCSVTELPDHPQDWDGCLQHNTCFGFIMEELKELKTKLCSVEHMSQQESLLPEWTWVLSGVGLGLVFAALAVGLFLFIKSRLGHGKASTESGGSQEATNEHTTGTPESEQADTRTTLLNERQGVRKKTSRVWWFRKQTTQTPTRIPK